VFIIYSSICPNLKLILESKGVLIEFYDGPRKRGAVHVFEMETLGAKIPRPSSLLVASPAFINEIQVDILGEVSIAELIF